jgi:hypothetical protein
VVFPKPIGEFNYTTIDEQPDTFPVFAQVQGHTLKGLVQEITGGADRY